MRQQGHPAGSRYPRQRMEQDTTAGTTALHFSDVSFRRGARDLLVDINWRVGSDENWVVIGANGSGKTSLIRIAALYEHPSSGTVELLGETLGRTDVRRLRRRVAMVSAAMSDMIRPQLDARDVVMCAKYAALEPWWHTYDESDRAKAESLLFAQGVGFTAEQPFGRLSSGERQRVMLARALMTDPALVLLDEPSAGLDLSGRESLVERLDQLAADPDSSPTVLVTHHVEEIPASYSHILALGEGRVLASGPIETTLDADLLSEAFSMHLILKRHSDGRFSARRASRP